MHTSRNHDLNFECKIENKSSIHRELTISVKAESVQAYVDSQFDSLQKKAKIKGFRQGKVPLPILRKYYMGDVISDVFSKVVQDSFTRAVEENKIQTVGSPVIEPQAGSTIKEGEGFTYTAKVEIFPEFKVSDLSKIKVSRPAAEVSEPEVERAIEDLRRVHAEILPDDSREGPAKDGDLVQLSYTGICEGKSPEGLSGANRFLKLGSGQYLDGFEKNVLGMRKGETRKFTIQLADSASSHEFAGKGVEFEVTLHEFKKEALPEPGDEFAKRFKAESMADLRARMKQDLQLNAERRARNALKERLVEALIHSNPFEMPSHFVNMQFEHLVNENVRELLQRGFTEKMVRDFLEKNRDGLKAKAEAQVRSTLLIDRIAQEENIRIEDSDLEREYARISAEEKVPLEQVRKFFESEISRRELRFRLKEERVFDFVKEKAKITSESKK